MRGKRVKGFATLKIESMFEVMHERIIHDYLEGDFPILATQDLRKFWRYFVENILVGNTLNKEFKRLEALLGARSLDVAIDEEKVSELLAHFVVFAMIKQNAVTSNVEEVSTRLDENSNKTKKTDARPPYSADSYFNFLRENELEETVFLQGNPFLSHWHLLKLVYALFGSEADMFAAVSTMRLSAFENHDVYNYFKDELIAAMAYGEKINGEAFAGDSFLFEILRNASLLRLNQIYAKKEEMDFYASEVERHIGQFNTLAEDVQSECFRLPVMNAVVYFTLLGSLEKVFAVTPDLDQICRQLKSLTSQFEYFAFSHRENLSFLNYFKKEVANFIGYFQKVNDAVFDDQMMASLITNSEALLTELGAGLSQTEGLLLADSILSQLKVMLIDNLFSQPTSEIMLSFDAQVLLKSMKAKERQDLGLDECLIVKKNPQSGFSPIWYAVEQGDLESVKLFAEVLESHLKGKHGQDGVSYLKESKWINTNKGAKQFGLIAYAGYLKHRDIVKFLTSRLLEKDAIHIRHTPRVTAYKSPVKAAFTTTDNAKHAALLSELLRLCGDNWNKQFENGETLLFKAARDGEQDKVEILLSYGADILIRNHQGESPLYIAFKQGHRDIASLLTKYALDSKKSFNVEKSESFGEKGAKMQFSPDEVVGINKKCHSNDATNPHTLFSTGESVLFDATNPHTLFSTGKGASLVPSSVEMNAYPSHFGLGGNSDD